MNIKSLIGGALVLGGLAAVVYAVATDEDEAMVPSSDDSLTSGSDETTSVEPTPNEDTPTE